MCCWDTAKTKIANFGKDGHYWKLLAVGSCWLLAGSQLEAGICDVVTLKVEEMENSVDLPPEKKIEKNNTNNMQNIAAKVL